MCINVSPSPSVMRSEPLVKHFQLGKMEIFQITFLGLCSIIFVLSQIDLNIRYISFNTRLNTLTTSKKKCNKNLKLFLLLLLYIGTFEFIFVILLPNELFKTLFDIRGTTKLSILLVKICHNMLANITLGAYYRCTYLICLSIVYSFDYPFETFAVWISLLRLILCPDIHPNPGPEHTNIFAGGFLSFCNWNLNTLSKDDFYRITLLQAHNTEHNYDIISLCETSLDDSVQVPEMPGYKFHCCNHPDGNRSGGVGIFYKESLPLKIREDLSFNESIVCELIFGNKHIFFTVLYRNPKYKANSVEFQSFLKIFENLHDKIKNQKPYAMFFTGDFNAQSQTWYPIGNTNPEGADLDNLFADLNLTQIISEPTHFMRDTVNPTCIDLIVTDQPNLVLNS